MASSGLVESVLCENQCGLSFNYGFFWNKQDYVSTLTCTHTQQKHCEINCNKYCVITCALIVGVDNVTRMTGITEKYCFVQHPMVPVCRRLEKVENCHRLCLLSYSFPLNLLKCKVLRFSCETRRR